MDGFGIAGLFGWGCTGAVCDGPGCAGCMGGRPGLRVCAEVFKTTMRLMAVSDNSVSIFLVFIYFPFGCLCLVVASIFLMTGISV